jgi:hypothetical protein
MTAAPPPLVHELAAGQITAKTRRWASEELLRTPIDAELAARTPAADAHIAQSAMARRTANG